MYTGAPSVSSVTTRLAEPLPSIHTLSTEWGTRARFPHWRLEGVASVGFPTKATKRRHLSNPHQEAADHRRLPKILEQELQRHYEQPRMLPQRLLTLLRKMKQPRMQGK